MAKIQIPKDTVTIDMELITTNKQHVEVKDAKCDLKHELRYVLRLMAAFGLYYPPNKWRKSGKCFQRTQRIYCLLIQLLLWLNVLKTITGLWVVDKIMAMQITMCAWWFLCAANSSIWFYICSTDKLPNIVNLWQTHCQSSTDSHTFGTSVDVKFVRRRILIILLCVLSFMVANISFPVFTRLTPIEFIRNDTNFLVVPTTEPIIVWEVIFIFSHVFVNGAFTFPLAFYLIICSILSNQFTKFSTKFMTSINPDDRKFKGCLVALRRQHQHLAKAVFVVDDAFSFYLAVTFGTLIMLACFEMYQLVVADDYKSFIGYSMTAMFFCTVSTKFAVVGILTAQVHNKVKK